jgi:hypothetical protein
MAQPDPRKVDVRRGTTRGTFQATSKKGVYRRPGSAYEWINVNGKFYPVRGSARFGPGKKRPAGQALYNPLNPLSGGDFDSWYDDYVKRVQGAAWAVLKGTKRHFRLRCTQSRGRGRVLRNRKTPPERGIRESG